MIFIWGGYYKTSKLPQGREATYKLMIHFEENLVPVIFDAECHQLTYISTSQLQDWIIIIIMTSFECQHRVIVWSVGQIVRHVQLVSCVSNLRQRLFANKFCVIDLPEEVETEIEE